MPSPSQVVAVVLECELNPTLVECGCECDCELNPTLVECDWECELNPTLVEGDRECDHQ